MNGLMPLPQEWTSDERISLAIFFHHVMPLLQDDAARCLHQMQPLDFWLPTCVPNFYCLYFTQSVVLCSISRKGNKSVSFSDNLAILRFSLRPNWLDYTIMIIVNISLSPTFEIQTKTCRGMKTLTNGSVQYWKGFLLPEWQKLPMYHPETFCTP